MLTTITLTALTALTAACAAANVPVYRNNGQRAEQLVRFTINGTAERADNVAATAAGDVVWNGLQLQIKSARATVCKGTDIAAHIEDDAAEVYGYVNKDMDTMYIMNPSKWAEFVNKFASVTRDSKKNGGREKLRLRAESKAMREWLAAA